ncbi:hypothetical protein HNO89_001773 [Sporosarcina luteola]|nr:hypothetical protein [Sporosarcina luteola]
MAMFFFQVAGTEACVVIRHKFRFCPQVANVARAAEVEEMTGSIFFGYNGDKPEKSTRDRWNTGDEGASNRAFFFYSRRRDGMDAKELLGYFLTQGPFAVLFVWLFWYQVKSSESRERRYQDLLEAMTEKYDDISDEIREVKERLPPK